MNSVAASTPTETWIRLRRVFGTALLVLALAAIVASCSREWREGPVDPREGENCVRDRKGPTARAINYVDPELCGRQVGKRGPYYVRIQRPEVETVRED